MQKTELVMSVNMDILKIVRVFVYQIMKEENNNVVFKEINKEIVLIVHRDFI